MTAEIVITIIAAIGKNRELGKEGKLLWHLSSDLKRFKALTRGHSVIMGRKTYASIGRPLPERTNVIVTRDLEYRAEGCVVVHSLDEALGAATGEEVFVIGGGQIYAEVLQRAERLYITHVDTAMDADTFFPEIDPTVWHAVKTEDVPKDEKNSFDSRFVVYERITPTNSPLP